MWVELTLQELEYMLQLIENDRSLPAHDSLRGRLEDEISRRFYKRMKMVYACEQIRRED